MFVDGQHRLAIAKVLGLTEIPARIVARHAEWHAFKEDILAYAESNRGRVYQQLDHPDLADIPAAHTDDRFPLLRDALAGYDPAGKRLVDIGAHWGFMSQQFSELGFSCTAVEANARNARFAERLSIATEAGYEVWRGDFADLPNPSDFDVVTALNIFHHPIKTREGHDRLLGFLERLEAELILFQPHRHDPPGQMKGAYRNYPPEEFAELVRSHAGMRDVKHLGTARDGRQLYLLSR